MKFVLKALIILFAASPAIAEDSALPYDPVKEIMDSRNKKSKGMQGASWNKTKNDKEEKEAEETAKTDAEETDNPLWNKYKEAEANTEEKQHEPKEETQAEKAESQENVEAETAETKAEEEKPKTGLAAILEKYKQSQENKGGMNSRSFGNLDR